MGMCKNPADATDEKARAEWCPPKALVPAADDAGTKLPCYYDGSAVYDYSI